MDHHIFGRKIPDPHVSFCCLYFLHLAIPCELRYNEIWRDGESVEKEVSIMCNLSQGIKEESEAKGEEKARTEIVLNMHKKAILGSDC